MRPSIHRILPLAFITAVSACHGGDGADETASPPAVEAVAQPEPVSARAEPVPAPVEAVAPATEATPAVPARQEIAPARADEPTTASPTGLPPRLETVPDLAVVPSRDPAATTAAHLEPPGTCAVSLNRAMLARGVEAREPYGVSSSFVARGEPVYVFMEVNNPGERDREMTIRWDHLESDHVFVQTIPAGPSPRWRTWVYHTIWPAFTGRWHVEILAPGGCRVADLSFSASAS